MKRAIPLTFMLASIMVAALKERPARGQGNDGGAADESSPSSDAAQRNRASALTDSQICAAELSEDVKSIMTNAQWLRRYECHDKMLERQRAAALTDSQICAAELSEDVKSIMTDAQWMRRDECQKKALGEKQAAIPAETQVPLAPQASPTATTPVSVAPDKPQPALDSTSASQGAQASGGGRSARAPNILWRDDIQAGGSPWGFGGIDDPIKTEHPIGSTVSPADATGANLSRVANPKGAGFALRHYAVFDAGGARSQCGIYSFANAAFGAQAKSPEGVWVAQEWYFPRALTAGGDPNPWLSLWDWHSTDALGGNRWDTAPGLSLATDGSMRITLFWNNAAASANPQDGPRYSTIALPVGRWFTIEMHYQWSEDATLQVWVDGNLALEQKHARTRASSHSVVETYMKFYGGTEGGAAWSPTPSLKYTRNIRVADGRMGQ